MRDPFSDEVPNQSGILIDNIYFPEFSLGPGVRAVVRVQGCSLKCKECRATNTWEFNEDKRTPWGLVRQRLIELSRKTRSLTITGGEPFDQFSELVFLVQMARDVGYKDIITFTNYSFKTLSSRFGDKFREFLSYVTSIVERCPSSGANLDEMTSEPDTVLG